MNSKTVSESQVTMTEMILPQHTNALGSAFGGIIMSWIDVCGAIAAQRHSRSQCVTASVDALQFIAPVFKGWFVNMKASVNYAGKTSMEVGVRLDAEDPMTGKTFHMASAYLTFVAVGEDKKPIAISPIVAETPDQIRRFKGAQVRREHRLELRERALNKAKK